MKKLLALLFACLALTIAACGDDDDDDGGGSTGATTTEQTETTPAEEGDQQGGGAPQDVMIVDNDYDPKELTVPAGTTVVWTNVGDAPHTVTADGEFDSGNLEPSQTFEHTFDEPGTVDYVCTIHPGQEGSVTVE